MRFSGMTEAQGSSAGRLAALLRRNESLADVTISISETIAAFCQAVVQGCCRRVRGVEIFGGSLLTEERSSLLAGALELHGALPALRSLSLHCMGTHGVLSALASALVGGTSPELQELECTSFTEIELVFLAEVLEARARIPGCKRLERFARGADSTFARSVAFSERFRAVYMAPRFRGVLPRGASALSDDFCSVS